MQEKDIHTLLKRYWGYDEFRYPQEEIIESVLSGHDTLALMPTGGGKSITYQISGLMLDGICLVVTPLIALMKDQVEGLVSRDLPAVALYTGMTHAQVDSNLNRLSGGRVKFLYISPERLESKNFRERIRHYKIAMIAVDEAHCISQWGYDFRPSYLRISEIRSFFPEIPILALTATATSEVVRDIQEQLAFKDARIFSKSFKRDNLVYVARKVEDKLSEVVSILDKVPGCAIVYVRTRQNAQKLAEYLKKNAISADYYHAGLSSYRREQRQQMWKDNETRVIVATNAFGMGIDKPDVRVVVHYDIPDSPEAYFQEAGRAGRDGKKAYAVLLYNAVNIENLKERATKAFPDKKYILQIYQMLADFFVLAEGEGEGCAFEFDMDQFVQAFHLDYQMMLAAVDILKVGGYLECTTAINFNSRVHFKVSRDELSKINITNPTVIDVVEYLLRTYPGLFSQYVFFDEQHMADSLHIEREQLYNALLFLARARIIAYVPGNDRPYIVYRRPRLPLSYIDISKEAYELRKNSYVKKINGMLSYLDESNTCRQVRLMRYFGQNEDLSDCGCCDICLERKRGRTMPVKLSDEQIKAHLSVALDKGAVDVKAFVNTYPDAHRKSVIRLIRQLLEEDVIVYVNPMQLGWQKKKG